jgi:SAM-dependent methyltransferase
MTTPAQRQSTTRFGPKAQTYAVYRPAYPEVAIDAALRGLGDPLQLTVADIGAGTGIASRLFAERVAAVIAIEPNDAMRSKATPDPKIEWRAATAEATGLPDDAVDVIAACQAFHWFATAEVMHEFRRIARRRAALLQYERDERDRFTKTYGDVVRSYASDDTEALRARALATFERFPGATCERTEWPLGQHLDREGLLGRAFSSSYLPSSGPQADALRNDLNAVFDRYAVDGHVELVMVTYVITADWT